jgi:hypothetical protein
MIVKVKKAKAESWNGLAFFVGAKNTIGASIDQFGRPVTGLTKEEEARFEKALSLPEGTLANTSDFWLTYGPTLDADSQTLILDTTIPEHEMQYKFLKAQKKVAKNLSELKRNADAKYVIYSEEAEAAEQNKKSKEKRSAIRLLDELSTGQMKELLLFYGKGGLHTNDDAVENALFSEVEADPAKFINYVTDDKLKLKVFALECKRYGIIDSRGKGFVLGDNVIAADVDEMATFLESKSNQAIYKHLKEELKRAKG